MHIRKLRSSFVCHYDISAFVLILKPLAFRKNRPTCKRNLYLTRFTESQFYQFTVWLISNHKKKTNSLQIRSLSLSGLYRMEMGRDPWLHGMHVTVASDWRFQQTNFHQLTAGQLGWYRILGLLSRGYWYESRTSHTLFYLSNGYMSISSNYVEMIICPYETNKRNRTTVLWSQPRTINTMESISNTSE